MTAGAFWADSLSGKEGELTMPEFIKFLEPDPVLKRGGAICQSAADWTKQKTAIEQLCALLKDRCKYEEINKAKNNIDGLINRGKNANTSVR